MPRANRRADDTTPLNVGRALGGATRRVRYDGQEWLERRVSGAAATSAYRCPGCQQQIALGQAHVVAWPAHGVGGVTDRRHWHTACWTNRDTRRPRGSYR